ncbi:MAG TPA: insulinase family protein, partial [bacterium]|nr:insulinase family protein [bacterium]
KDLPPEFPRGKDTQTAPRTFGLEGAFESTSAMMIFKAPEFDQPTTYALDILMQVLGQGESSRLTKRLRDELGLVSSIGASNYSLIDASALYITYELIDPAKATEATDAILEVMARMRREGPTPEELARAKRQAAIGRVFEQETVLGQARSIGYTATSVDLTTWEQYLDRIFGVTAQDVQWAAQQYLHSANATLGIIGPEGTEAINPDWSKLDIQFTKLIEPTDMGRRGQNPLAATAAGAVDGDEEEELYTLANGLQVYLNPSHANATVGISMGIKGGLVWEAWDTAGVANMAMESLAKGTTTRSADEIARIQDELGTFIASDATRDYLVLNTLVLASDAQMGLDLLADLAQNPTFPDEEVAKVREQVLQGLKAEQDDQTVSTLNQLRYAMYGPDHPYGRPYNGRESVVARLSADDLRAFHRRAMHP